ncbi:ribosomal protein S18-alanine N-acetyltransferase [Rothia sp. ZJ1223]|uniref:ribosomal protein S18-alanine N-acetyltransferase n=1 Tax=Rothia sp. ZJ1223 TaxID=2811098 RepID=UPI00195C7C0C|nr:ribosomal protein S18-alanine N-acetyltransferase [Rothia sp. ZJ1223]MBM7051181.1 ribosomal protein S18-alanine N-acetyltransferase [Rothia sp. ZJ1223]
MSVAELPQPLGPVSFRRMTLHDLEQVHTLERYLFPADAWPIDMFLAEIQHETRSYLVAEDTAVRPTSIIGYAGVMSVADTADVQTIAVAPQYEGKGIGRALLDYLHREAAARGAQTILLEVRADNPRAQDLYTRNGYSHIHTRPRYYNDGVDALIMQASLTDPTNSKETPR